MKRRTDRTSWLRLVSTLLIVVLLAACTGGGTAPATQAPAGGTDQSGDAGGTEGGDAGGTEGGDAGGTEGGDAGDTEGGDTGGTGETTQLLLWDQAGAEATGIDAIIADWNAAHPDIQVTREGMPTEAQRDILRTAIDSGEGPDIIFFDTGPGFAGVLARADLLVPMDEAYEQYGWNERLLPVAKQRTTFDGQAYGIGHQLEVVGVFYNQRIFEEQGLEVPETHEELLEVCDQLSEAGIYPIAFGDQEGWEAGHTFSVFAGNIAGREKLAQAISAEVPWNDPDFVAAIDIPFVQMRERGCFNPEVTSITYDDANALFYSGQAAMSLTGSWMVSEYSNPETMPDPVGFFFYPSVDGNPIAPPAGLGSGYFVTKLADNPDAAFQFLDYLFSEETAVRWLTEVGDVPPVQIDTSALDVTDLLRTALDALQNNADQMSYNIDVLTPENFNNMMFTGFQEVLVGGKTAQEQADDLQAEMEEAAADGRVLDITE